MAVTVREERDSLVRETVRRESAFVPRVETPKHDTDGDAPGGNDSTVERHELVTKPTDDRNGWPYCTGYFVRNDVHSTKRARRETPIGCRTRPVWHHTIVAVKYPPGFIPIPRFTVLHYYRRRQ